MGLSLACDDLVPPSDREKRQVDKLCTMGSLLLSLGVTPDS